MAILSELRIGFYKLSFSFFWFNYISRIPTPIPRIPTLIPRIPTQIRRIPTHSRKKGRCVRLNHKPCYGFINKFMQSKRIQVLW